MSQPTSSRSNLAEALSGWPPPVLDPHGPFSNTVTSLTWVLIALVTLIFVLVCAAMWVALYGSDSLRARLGGEGVVKWFGLIVPAGVLFLLLAWGTTMVAGMTTIQGNELRMRVSGNIYWWRVSYLDAAGNETHADANELHIPVGRPVGGTKKNLKTAGIKLDGAKIKPKNTWGSAHARAFPAIGKAVF